MLILKTSNPNTIKKCDDREMDLSPCSLIGKKKEKIQIIN